MIIKQFYLGCLAHASYLVIDESTRSAAVIDPQRDIEQYLEEAERHGAAIDRVLLTHFHADFVAGHLELRARTGARIHLGAKATAEYAFDPLSDGDVVAFGDVRLEVLETPGHTPEGVSLVAKDASQGDAPVAVFTGDTLFVGDVGRPDLLASAGVTSEELAGWLYDSLHGKLMGLPDETTVYPAHGAGSLCGKNLGSETFTTIGAQRRSNYALQPMSKEEFIALVSTGQSVTPQYFPNSVAMNRAEHELLDDSLAGSLVPLSRERALELQADGAKLLDVRAPREYAKGHARGSLNVGLKGKFATWAGTVLSPKDRIVVIADPGTEREAAMRLGRIGLDRVEGFLDGGVAALGDDLVVLDEIEVGALAEELERKDDLVVLDVRAPGEREAGHIEGSLHIPLGELPKRIRDVPTEKRVAVVCKSGYRSTVSSSLLALHGHARLVNVVGGMDAWAVAALPVRVPAGASGENCT
ncbi:MAG: MBL fold metallo-hydrolase [Planctomycetota bacterium]